MNEPKHLKSKEHSQLERVVFFSDGVFAIAITLMAIEIKVPVLTEFTDHALSEHLSEMLLKFLGFLISFAIVGYYLIVHHKIFGYVQKCSNTLLWVNLGFLLSVVILPFSSGLLGEYSSHLNMKLPYGFYTLNMCFTGFMNCYLWYVVSNPETNLLTHTISKERIKLGIYRSLIVPIVFIVSFIVSFIFPLISRFIPLTIPFILNYGMKKLEENANKAEEIPQDDDVNQTISEEDQLTAE